MLTASTILVSNVDSVNINEIEIMSAVQSSANFLFANRLSREGRYGPVALVTGASDGIGREFARALATKSFDLVIVARRLERLEELAEELRGKYRINVTIIQADLGKADDVEAVLKATDSLDIGLFVATAGFGSAGLFTDLPTANELDMIDVNCRAVVQMTATFAERFKARKRGGIILMGSLVGFQGVSYSSTYAATKAFIQTFAEGLRGGLKRFGIDVISVAPGPVATGFGPRAGMKLTIAAHPRSVANSALSALGRQTTVVPGWFSKLLSYSLLPVPRWGKTMILTRIMKNMSH